MLETIYVGMTGLLGYSQGLRVIANNTANINTPGFKSSTMQFADLFYEGRTTTNGDGQRNPGQIGHGLNATGTLLSFRQGELRQTGEGLDVAVDGQGLFVLKDDAGRLSYTRAGQFQFNKDGVLTTPDGQHKVLGFNDSKELVEFSLAGLRTTAGRATATVSFAGNLSSTATEQVVGNVKVINAAGGEHLLSLKFKNDSATTPGAWTVELQDGVTTVASGQIVFVDGQPEASSSKLSMTFTPAGQVAIPLTLDFSKDVTSFASGNLSTLALSSQDGLPPGGLTGISFSVDGALELKYSNGQTIKGHRLALAKFDSLDVVTSMGGNRFDASNAGAWTVGLAGVGGFGSIRAGSLELSNVDLSREFSDLVIMQRGYQASSQVVSTANEMLQELFSMKGRT